MLFKKGIVAIACVAVLGSCGGSSNDAKYDCTANVFAASSLSTALTDMTSEIQDALECEITFTFGSSGALAASISNGTKPDAFISSGLDALAAAGLDTADAHALVESHLAIITQKGSTAETEVLSVENLLDTQWKFGVCSASAPCGELADLVLLNAMDVYGEEFDFSREALADTEAPSASALLTKLNMGELDVVLGYASSCAGQSDLSCTAIPDSFNGRHLGEKSTYYVSILGSSKVSTRLREYLYSFTFPGRLVSDFGFEKLS